MTTGQAAMFRQMAAGYDQSIRVFQPTYDAMLALSRYRVGVVSEEVRRPRVRDPALKRRD